MSQLFNNRLSIHIPSDTPFSTIERLVERINSYGLMYTLCPLNDIDNKSSRLSKWGVFDERLKDDSFFYVDGSLVYVEFETLLAPPINALKNCVLRGDFWQSLHFHLQYFEPDSSKGGFANIAHRVCDVVEYSDIPSTASEIEDLLSHVNPSFAEFLIFQKRAYH